MYNVGALFRLADALQIEKVFLCGFTPYPPRQKIGKVARHMEESVPWAYYKSTSFVLDMLKTQGVSIVALERNEQSIAYTDGTYSFPVALVLGFEVDGLQEETLSQADAVVEIPMLGKNNSLNVAVAAGIVMYHVHAEWRKSNYSSRFPKPLV